MTVRKMMYIIYIFLVFLAFATFDMSINTNYKSHHLIFLFSCTSTAFTILNIILQLIVWNFQYQIYYKEVVKRKTIQKTALYSKSVSRKSIKNKNLTTQYMLDDKELVKEIEKTKGIKIKEADTYFQFVGVGTFIITMILMIIHPAPFLLTVKLSFLKESYYFSDGVFIYFTRPLYEYCLLVQVLYCLSQYCKVYLETRHFMTHRTQRIAQMGNHTIDYVFALRYYLKKYPILAPMFLLFFGAVFFGSCLRIAEVGSWNYVLENPADYPTADAINDAKGEFQVLFSYINTAWYVFITITTVGYGDIYVKGTLSRIFMYAFGLWGMISLSMTIATFMNLLGLDDEEIRFLKLMNYFKIKKAVTYLIFSEKTCS